MLVVAICVIKHVLLRANGAIFKLMTCTNICLFEEDLLNVMISFNICFVVAALS